MDMVSLEVRRLLAAELKLVENTLTRDFRWLDEVSNEDVCYLLARLNERFTSIPVGLSVGDGQRPFNGHVSSQTLERIATVGSLIEFLQGR